MKISDDDKKRILKLCKNLYKMYIDKIERGELDLGTVSEIVKEIENPSVYNPTGSTTTVSWDGTRYTYHILARYNNEMLYQKL